MRYRTKRNASKWAATSWLPEGAGKRMKSSRWLTRSTTGIIIAMTTVAQTIAQTEWNRSRRGQLRCSIGKSCEANSTNGVRAAQMYQSATPRTSVCSAEVNEEGMLDRYCIMMLWPASNTPTKVNTIRINAACNHQRAKKRRCGGAGMSPRMRPGEARSVRVIKFLAIGASRERRNSDCRLSLEGNGECRGTANNRDGNAAREAKMLGQDGLI